MNWVIRALARLTGSVPPGDGAQLSDHEYWVLTGRGKFGKFDLYRLIQQASDFFPDGSVLYVEGTSIARDVQEFLVARQAGSTMPIITGTYWPKPRTYHMPCTRENMAALAEIAGHHAEPEICDHLVIYRVPDVLMEWWDTPAGAILLRPEMPEHEVAEFAQIMDASYERKNDD